jgi:hypothetical protein
MAAAIAEGASWAEVVGAERLSTDAVGGPIVLENDGGELKAKPTIFMALPLEVVIEKLAVPLFRGPSAVHPLLHELLQTEWGTLALLGRFNVVAFRHVPALIEPAVRAAVRWWPTWDAVGARYSWKGEPGERLWNESSFGLKVVLGGLGMSREQVLQPLPPGGLAELLAKEKIDLG